MADPLLSIGEGKQNLEDLSVVWLDEQSHDLKARSRLRCVINFQKIFTDLADCLDYIRSVPKEHLFVIVSGQLSSLLIPSVRDLPQVLHVYVFCHHPSRYLSLPSSGVFASEEVLYQQLSKDVNHFCATHGTVLSSPTEKSLRDLGEEKGEFFWFQIFITALMDMVPSDDAKDDLLRLARSFHVDNELELMRIDHFDQTYRASEALNWYSCDSFVYRVLNKAVRTEDLDLLFAYRFFITDLYRQLETLHKPFVESMRSSDRSELTVYHGQQLTEEELKRLAANVGQLISVNSFLSTSLDRKVALIYAGAPAVQSNMRPVLFQVRIPLQERSNIYQHPFADISAFSQFQEEEEVLFALAAMFIVESITEEAADLWVVQLLFIESTEEMEEMRTLSTRMGRYRNQQTTLVDIAHLFFYTGDLHRTIHFCQKCLNQASENWSLAVQCYSILGQACRNQPELALQSFEAALELQLRHGPDGYNALATAYNNMGFAHRHLASSTQVVVGYYEKALQMCTAVSDENLIEWPLTATILNNLVASQGHGDVNLALAREQLVLQIRLKYLPLSHPLIAATHLTLAEIYDSDCQFEQALVHYYEALGVRMKYLPEGHPSIADCYVSIALAHLQHGDRQMLQDLREASEENYQKAIELNHRAIAILMLDQSPITQMFKSLSFAYNNCAVVYIQLGRLQEALDYLHIAEHNYNKYLPAGHDNHGALLKNKGKVFTLQGDLEKGMDYYQQAVAFYQHNGSTSFLRLPQLYFNIGEWYELCNQHHSAIEYYERAFEMGTKAYKPCHTSLLKWNQALNRVKAAVKHTVEPVEQASWI